MFLKNSIVQYFWIVDLMKLNRFHLVTLHGNDVPQVISQNTCYVCLYSFYVDSFVMSDVQARYFLHYIIPQNDLSGYN